MAKIYNDFQPANLMSFAKSFARLNGQPLDKSEIWYSFDEAAAYAATDAAYVGQILAVIDSDNGSVKFWGIQDAAGNLEEVGAAVLGDDLSVEVVDGVIQLKGFGSEYYAYVPAERNEAGEITAPSKYVLTEGFKAGLEPRVIANAEGKMEIAWYEPGSETIEDVSANVEAINKTVDGLENVVDELDVALNAEGGLVDQVEDLQTSVGHAADDTLGAATGLYAEIEKVNGELADITEELGTKADTETVNNALAEKANAADVYNKTEVYTKTEVNAAIADANHLKRVVVDSVDDIDEAAADAEQYIYMVPTGLQADDDKYDEYMVIDGMVEKVGSWEVDLKPYATIAYVDDELAKKVDAADGKRLMTDAEGEKLEGIEAGAQVNYIDEVSNEFTVTEGLLELKAISKDKVTGLADDLSALEDAIADEAERAGAAEQALAGDVSGLKTDVENLETAVSNLEAEVDGKVDAVEGSRLITDNEAQKLEALVVDEETGSIAISGTVNANKVQELYDKVVTIVTGTGNGVYDNVERPNLAIEAGAEVNIIASVSDEFSIDENRKLSINIVDGAKLDLSKNETVVAIQDSITQNANDISTLNIAVEKAAQDLDTLSFTVEEYITTNNAAIEEIREHLTWVTLPEPTI